MGFDRRRAALAIACALAAAPAAAVPFPDYPARPVRFIVPFPPAGGMDTLARIVSHHMTERWSQPVLVDNRPGAAGAVGTSAAARAAPDGHTLLMAATSHALLPHVNPRLPYDPVADFDPVAALASTEHVLLVSPALAATSVQELVSLARSRQHPLAYGSNGIGSMPHLGVELLSMTTGIRVKNVPYQGAQPALADLATGQVQMYFATQTSCLAHVRSGRARAIAISGRQRSPLLPDVPTLGESGLHGFEVTSLYGIMVPARTPRGIRARIEAEVARIQALPEIPDTLRQRGMEMVVAPGARFGRILRHEAEQWSRVLTSSTVRRDG